MSQSKNALQQLQAQFSQEREHLAQQLQELSMEHQHRECRLQEVHCCALQDIEDAQQMELRVTAPSVPARLTRTLINRHVEDIHLHMQATRKLSDEGENPGITLESMLRRFSIW